MKLGAFGFVKDYEAMQAAGYDYAELDMPELEAMDEAAFKAFKQKANELKFPILTGARILPIVEPTFFVDGFKPESLSDYLKKSCARSAELGIKKVILGNGKARSLQSPDDLKKEPVFIDFLTMLARIAKDNEQELIFEPLGPKYSNYINTVPQAVELISRVDADNIFVMADLRHMVWSKEDLADLSACIKHLHHVHVDYPLSFPERGYPKPSDDYDYSAFIQAVKASGFNDTLTIEADVPEDWKQAHDLAFEVLKDLF